MPLLIQRHHAPRTVNTFLLWFVHRHHATTIILGRVAGDVGLRHHFRNLIVAVIKQRNPGAGTDAMQTTFPHKLVIIDGVNDAPGNVARTFNVAVRKQQTKFIATQTC
ncbi:hypothetical protein D3C80_1451830 [compost metagenome]